MTIIAIIAAQVRFVSLVNTLAAYVSIVLPADFLHSNHYYDHSFQAQNGQMRSSNDKCETVYARYEDAETFSRRCPRSLRKGASLS